MLENLRGVVVQRPHSNLVDTPRQLVTGRKLGNYTQLTVAAADPSVAMVAKQPGGGGSRPIVKSASICINL